MEKYQEIISKGKVSASEFGYSFLAWGSNILIILVSIWGFYYVNTKWTTDDREPNKVIWGNIVMIFLAIFSSYILILTKKKLRLRFYKDKRTIEKKHHVIQHLKNENHWRLKKEDINYYLFFENNILISSYYITIVIDESGFYLNCFPFKSRVLDFGRSNRYCDELYKSIHDCL